MNNCSHMIVLNPTRVDTFDRCRLEYDAKYNRGIWGADAFSSALAHHNVTHAILRAALSQFARDRSLPIDLADRIRAEQRNPRHRYPDQDHRDADLPRILDWVHRGLSWFDGDGRILGVERDYEFCYPGSERQRPFKLCGRPDLVRELPSGEIEIVDWKSGAVYPNELQMAIGRIIVGHNHPGRVIRTTTVYLAADPDICVVTTVMTDDETQSWWRYLNSTAHSIGAEEEWAPTTNTFCPLCPLYHDGCPLFVPITDPSATAKWLDGVAA